MKTKSRLLGGIAHGALLLGMTQPALAQESGYALGMILLTGEKNAKTIESTATSVQVVTGDEVKPQSGDISEVLKTVPNLLDVGTGVAPTIRGIESQGAQEGAVAFFAGTTPRATINVDGHYQNYYEYVNGGTSLWDIDTIEVYRGPQTTKQGANSVAGATIVNTKDPTFEPEAAAQLLGGSYNTRRASVALSGPVAPDIAMRFSADYFSRDNYVELKDAEGDGGDTNRDFESQTYRAKLLWAPADIPGFEAKLTYAHVDSNEPTSESVPFPYDGDLESSDYGPTLHVISDSVIADVSHDFGNGITLANQLSYSQSVYDRTLEEYEDGTAHVESDGWSNELRANYGDALDPVSGIVGLFYSQTDQDDDIYLVYGGNGGQSVFDNDKTSTGLYGELTWRPTERLAVTGGLRFQHDEIARSGTYESYLFGTTNPVDYDEDFDAILPNLGLAYSVTDDTTVGVSVSKGYNPGGSGINFVTSDYYEYDEETVWTYEAYARSSLLNDRLFLTANLFYSDYRDQQIYSSRTTYNAERAETYGIEVAADYQATETLRLTAGMGLLRTEILEFDDVPSLEGNELSRAPHGTFSLGASWDVTDRLTLGGDLRHVTGYFSDADNTSEYEVDPYTVANLSASYDLNDRFELYGYVNNVFDENEVTWVRSATGSASARVTDPRMIGIGVRMQF
ncbi:TonB-dependent receptor [Alloyangia pacifica]|uniref:TonB-dependent siderophore receptor n=1 Tax=Alloyangia pacifica TaxID=311180 RepID=A0A1I6SY48_9RHOB|nr:TonB-dependent receptor [Alloyangia pacifica]SDG90839.1 TonB-dependent siderophore receptor [Alloyangia pacifica]SFS81728.1 TonB-dependent siderophore receptor [Alloyangia pacifica]